MGRKRKVMPERGTNTACDDIKTKPSLSKKVKLLKDKTRKVEPGEHTSTAGSSSSSKTTIGPSGDSSPNGSRYSRSFFDVPCVNLAKTLLGKKLTHKLADGTLLSGVIVETEAYLGGDDKASHSYQGKKTPKTEAMFMEPGTIYVYHIYGVYTCINISAQGEGAAVLLRAVDPVSGEDKMRVSRGVKRSDKGAGLKDKDLGSGPSKLTQALQISKDRFNKADIVSDGDMWLGNGVDVVPEDIITSSRVGVDYADDWAKKPLRFYVRGNKSISVRDKEAEKAQDGST